MRTSTASSWVAPSARTWRSWIARSSLDCMASGRSPISSRNSVPPLRGLEVALAVGGGAGVRTLAGAEELGLQQRLGDRAAVDRDEGAVAAVAAGVQGARHQLLAGAGLAAHQHRRHAAGHLGDALLDLLHGRRRAHQPLQRGLRRRCRRRRPLGARRRAAHGGACRRLPVVDGRSHHAAELLAGPPAWSGSRRRRPSGPRPRSRPSRRRSSRCSARCAAAPACAAAAPGRGRRAAACR